MPALHHFCGTRNEEDNLPLIIAFYVYRLAARKLTFPRSTNNLSAVV